MSKKLSDAAYDGLGADDAELVESCVNTSNKISGGRGLASPPPSIFSAKLKGPTIGEKHMRDIDGKGQERRGMPGVLLRYRELDLVL